VSQPVTPPPSHPSDTAPGFPPAGDPGYPPPAAPQQQGVSGLAITGLILAIFIAPIGFILSVIAIFQTGPGKKRGRGLAIAGVILSVVISVGSGIAIAKFVADNATVADPGCIAGKAAIFKMGNDPTLDSINATIAELNAASTKAKDDKVRAAFKTLADDYTKLIADAKAGKAPDAAAMDKVTADEQAVDELCTIGS
jgi:hypothetical protein